MKTQVEALILAAGRGSRMKSELPKVLHPILGKPMISYVIEATKSIGCSKTTLITGYKSKLVQSVLSDQDICFVEQSEQLGTGHAVQCFVKSIKESPQHLLIVCGDTPLLSANTLEHMLEQHFQNKPAITMMTLFMEKPGNYGRILRHSNGSVIAIREAKDCSSEQLEVKEVNLAVYLFDGKFLIDNIFSLDSGNLQKEYYLTDLIEIAVNQNRQIVTVTEKDESSTLGINSRQHLAEVSSILQKQVLERLMDDGVTITSPQSTFIGSDVLIGSDSVVHPGCMISGKCNIGSNCIIGPNSRIVSSSIGDNCIIESCIINKSKVASNSSMKPFSLIEG